MNQAAWPSKHYSKTACSVWLLNAAGTRQHEPTGGFRTYADLEPVCRVQWPPGRWASRRSPAAVWALPHLPGFQPHNWRRPAQLGTPCRRNTAAHSESESCSDTLLLNVFNVQYHTVHIFFHVLCVFCLRSCRFSVFLLWDSAGRKMPWEFPLI